MILQTCQADYRDQKLTGPDINLQATSNNRDFGVKLAFCGHGGQECR